MWALGVLLYYLLLHDYPFHFKGNDEGMFKEEFMRRCSKGFSFSEGLEGIEVTNNHVKGNKHLEDFFKRVFQITPSKRMTLGEVK